MATVNMVFTIIAAVLSLCGIVSLYFREKLPPQGKILRSARKYDEMNPTLYRIMLTMIVLIGVLIRVWQFGEVPGGMNQDGAMAAVDGKALADYGTDRFGTWHPAHLYAWGYGQMSSLLSYMIAIFVKLFGLSPITARLPLLLMSLLGGMFLYLFMKDNFGKKAALIAAAIVAVNPWHLLQSRWALDCNLLPHFFMGGLYFFSKGLLSKKRYLYLSMLFFGLCMYCYGITIYTIPVFLLAAAIFYLIKKQIRFRDVLISVGIYLLIAWPFILTMALNYFQWETIKLPFVTLQYFSESVRSQDVLLFSDHIGSQLWSNIRYLLNITLLQLKDAPQNDIEGFYTMYRFMIPFFAAGVIGLPKLKVTGKKSLAVFAISAGVWAGILTNNVNVNRVSIIYYGMMIFAALGIYIVVCEFKYFVWPVGIMITVGGVMLINTYFGTYNKEISERFYAGFGDAVVTAEQSGADKLYITADIQGRGLWKVSEILTMFYDGTDALYYQGKTNINHNKECLPYHERFIYESISADTLTRSKSENAAYVILNSDKLYFNADEYTMTDFGKYTAVVKK